MAKVPSGHTKNKKGSALREAPVESADEWSQPETTQVDARIEDRSDWARPVDPQSVQHIEKMLEEALVDVPLSPIEDHRAAGDQPGAEPPPARRARTVLIAAAGLVAVAAAAWLLMQNNLLPIRF
jgi:hypothetical protein